MLVACRKAVQAVKYPSPVGTNELSPALQCWEREPRGPSPVGTNAIIAPARPKCSRPYGTGLLRGQSYQSPSGFPAGQHYPPASTAEKVKVTAFRKGKAFPQINAAKPRCRCRFTPFRSGTLVP